MADECNVSEIQEFFTEQNILITGATGFLGKVLLEKLVRSCRGINTIYLLIRSKGGKNVQERVDAIFDNVLYERVKQEYPDFRKKIVGVEGDIMVRGLGLSDNDRAIIIENISVIFHVAATVRFDESLKTAVAVNVNSVKEIVDLSRDCKNLKAAVYVSTAYSHCIREMVGEELYEPPMSYEEINSILDIFENRKWSPEMITALTQQLTGKWPNTYVYTKAIGEDVVAEYATDLPFGIFRPSIVMPTANEPITGWINSFFGINGIFLVASLGVVHVLSVDGNVRIDLIPVDMTCNALIAFVWEISRMNRRDRKIPVQNYVSGVEKPMSLRMIYQICSECYHKVPTNLIVTYPWVIFTKSEILFKFLDAILHLTPALIIDGIRKLLGKKPYVHKIYTKLSSQRRFFQFFALRSWNFRNEGVQNLWNRLGSKDKQIFPFSIRNLDLNDYAYKTYVGGQKFIFREEMTAESTKRAVRKQKILFSIHVFSCVLIAAFVLWIFWKLLRL